MKRFLAALFGLTAGCSLAVATAILPALLLVASRPAFASDTVNGQRLWESRCTGCHSLDEDRIGPRHRGVFGRKAGSIAEFNYSPAVKSAGFTWDEIKLDAWLTNPQALLPGQRMNFRVAKAEDRADIIAYLKSVAGPAKP
jgi:cytochrome c